MATASNKTSRPTSPEFKPKMVKSQSNVGYTTAIPSTKMGKGIKIRGTGAAIKGTKANGPMA